LRKAIALDEFLDAKVELLKFLKSYVMMLGKKVNPYVVDLKVGYTKKHVNIVNVV